MSDDVAGPGWVSLDGERFLGGKGAMLIVRLHEVDSAFIRWELHDNGKSASGGVCPVGLLPLDMRVLLGGPAYGDGASTERCARCGQFLSAVRVQMRLSLCSDCDRSHRRR